MSNTQQYVETELRDSVRMLRLNRPSKRNALDSLLISDVHDTLQEAMTTAERPLLLTGAGDVTCAGMDTKMVSHPEYPEAFQETLNTYDKLCSLLETYPLPTAMAGQGALIGSGFALSLLCDVTVLGADTTYAYPEIEYGLVGSSVDRLTQTVGAPVAKEIMFTADPIAPDRARELGLVNDVVPAAEVEQRTQELLSRTAAHDRETTRKLKAAFLRETGETG